MRETNVSQNPGPVMVFAETPERRSISCFTRANRAISMAKAMRVSKAARKDSSDAISVTVTCDENAKTNARNVTAVATGWTASPRVQLEPMVTVPPLLGAST